MKQIFLLVFSFIFTITLFFSPAFADTLSLDKQKYVFGDVLKITGKVSHVQDEFIGLQIINPSKSDIVLIDQFFPQKNGSFIKSYKTQGPKWNESGIYTIRLVYNDQILENKFDFKNLEKSQNESISENPKIEIKENEIPEISPPQKEVKDPKLRIQGFPNPENSPRFYLERFDKEPEYQAWFKEIFPDYSIKDVVGYSATHIPGFPDEKNSPWYYIDRYNNEENYRDWFDSQFPTKSIYEVLDYPEELFQRVPEWVKNNAKWWASDLITDSDFLNGISYLIDEKILVIPPSYEIGTSNSQKIPIWVKSTAGWWAEGKIHESEFLKGIQFLIENGIIKV